MTALSLRLAADWAGALAVPLPVLVMALAATEAQAEAARAAVEGGAEGGSADRVGIREERGPGGERVLRVSGGFEALKTAAGMLERGRV